MVVWCGCGDGGLAKAGMGERVRKLQRRGENVITMLEFLFPYKSYSTQMSVLILALRLLFGLLLMWHGLTKIVNFESIVENFPNPLGLGSKLSLYLTIFAEVFCSVGVIMGAFYRLALMPIIFSMGVALIVVHHGDSFAAKELAGVFFAVFVMIFVTGAGRYSLDNFLAAMIHDHDAAKNVVVQSEATPHRQDSERLSGDAPRR